MSLNVALDIAGICSDTLPPSFKSTCADREVKGDDVPKSNLNPETGHREEETNEEVEFDSAFGNCPCSLMETRGS